MARSEKQGTMILRRFERKQRARKEPSPRFIKHLISSMDFTQEGFQHLKFDKKNE